MSAVMADERLSGYQYHLLRASLERFSTGIDRLDERQLTAARQLADRTWRLESRVLDSAEAGEVVIPQRQVDEAFSEVAARYSDEAALQADLDANGLDETRLRQALYRELVFDSTLQRVSSRRPEVSQLDARLYYELHPDKFTRPEQRTARQILITVNDDFAENTRAAARARIERIAAKLAASPGRFADQARRHSECPSALEGGRLGTLSRGQLFPELDSALFALDEGEFSGVLETEVGFHLLWCEKIMAARNVPFSRAEAGIRRVLEERNRRNCQKAWLKRLEAEHREDAQA